MAELDKIFGEGRMTWDELLIKAGEAGVEIGDVGELKRVHAEEVRGIRLSDALERELDSSGVKNRALLTRVLDLSAVVVDEDGVHGLTEQIASLRESDPYMFEAAEDAVETVRVRTGLPHRKSALDADRLSDADYYKKIKKL